MTTTTRVDRKRDAATSVKRTLSVIAQDPVLRGEDGSIVMSKVEIPQETLDPGPIGYRVQVVDYDATQGRFNGAHELPANGAPEPKPWAAGHPAIVDDFRFHAQNVYALVMKTLARFEYALGRRVSWSFKTHQLKIAPHGMLDANAFYAPDVEGLVFGYFPGVSGKTVYACLSHDVVVHETTHALIDALRERYLDPSSPDQAALHEGLADVIALLSVFAQEELVRELLRRGRRRKVAAPDMIHAGDVTTDALRQSALFGLAEQMGQEMEGIRGSALRQSALLPRDPGLKDTAEYLEPHRRGELLVAAVLDAFVRAWAERISGLAPHGKQTYSLTRVAEEGSDIADVMVTMWIRGLDYMPPVHVEFADALSGVLTGDTEARPDDHRFKLRAFTRESFAAFGFKPAARTVDGTWPSAPGGVSYDNVRFEAMRTEKDEVFRFLWDNREVLELRPGAYTEVLSVRPCIRVGTDGYTLRETVAEYYQVARLTPDELADCKVRAPKGWLDELKARKAALHEKRASAIRNGDSDKDEAAAGRDEEEDLVTPLYGGGVLVFDDYGRLKYWIHNDVFGARQSERLLYLYNEGLLRATRTGARLSAARLAAIHRLRATDARRFPKEGW